MKLICCLLLAVACTSSREAVSQDRNVIPLPEPAFWPNGRLAYDNGGIACAQHTFPWRQDYAPGNWDNDKWEFYHLDVDFSEANDLAAKMPEKLAAMKSFFDEEAEKNHVYPLDDRGTGRIYIPKPSPGGSDPKRTRFTYYSGAVRLAETTAANTKNRSHTIEADISLPEKGGEGVLAAIGGSSGGYSLYVQDGKLVYHFNWFDETRTVITSSEPVPAGNLTIRFDFAYDGGDLGSGGVGTLFINDKKVGESRIEKTVPGRFGIDTFGIGMDTGSPVSNTYKPPFAFTGTIHEVRVELK